jgi:hypothetical protein
MVSGPVVSGIDDPIGLHDGLTVNNTVLPSPYV